MDSKENLKTETGEHPTAEPKANFWLETIKLAIVSLAIVIPFRYFIAQPFVVSGASMDPTFGNGEYLVIDEISYRFGSPERGDVIVFKYPYGKATYYIKRIVGLPGETIIIKDGAVTIKTANGETVPLAETYIKNKSGGNFEATLDKDEYYVLGDNRPASSDSRVWGPLESKFIVGKPILRLLPVSRAGIQPGDMTKSGLNGK